MKLILRNKNSNPLLMKKIANKSRMQLLKFKVVFALSFHNH
jgi:hypothetical protein